MVIDYVREVIGDQGYFGINEAIDYNGTNCYLTHKGGISLRPRNNNVITFYNLPSIPADLIREYRRANQNVILQPNLRDLLNQTAFHDKNHYINHNDITVVGDIFIDVPPTGRDIYWSSRTQKVVLKDTVKFDIRQSNLQGLSINGVTAKGVDKYGDLRLFLQGSPNIANIISLPRSGSIEFVNGRGKQECATVVELFEQTVSSKWMIGLYDSIEESIITSRITHLETVLYSYANYLGQSFNVESFKKKVIKEFTTKTTIISTPIGTTSHVQTSQTELNEESFESFALDI